MIERAYGKNTRSNPPTARLMKGSSVIMAKPIEDAENDLSLDIAEAVGKTVGNIVNRIEALDSERNELIKKLQDARASLNDQFSKWLPAGLGTAGTQVPGKKRRAASDKPCPICHVRGHDKRHHRNHPAKFSKDELRARNLPTGD